MTNTRGESGSSDIFYSLGPQITVDSDCGHEIKRCLFLGRKTMTNLDSILKSRDITLPTNVHLVKSTVFPVFMWQLDYKESWVLKSWWFQIVILERILESPLDSKEIKPVNPKGNQPWILIGKTVSGAEAPILCPLDVKSWLMGKDPHAGEDWGQEEKEATEAEMFGWHHGLSGHEFEQVPGDSEGKGSLACCSPWGCKELNTS